MTDRSTPNTPDNKPSDALLQLYHEANTQDPQNTGPSPAASERILAHARAQAARRTASAANAGDAAVERPELPTAPSQKTGYGGEPANDRRWLRQALGGLAAIGLVGWLTLHHLDEPGAPQLDSPAPASAPQVPSGKPAPAATAPAATASAPAAADAAADAAPAIATEIAAVSADKSAPGQDKAVAEVAKETMPAERRARSAAVASADSQANSSRAAEASLGKDRSAMAQNEKSVSVAAAPPAPAPAAPAAPAREIALDDAKQPSTAAIAANKPVPAAAMAAPAAAEATVAGRADSRVQAEVLAEAAPSAAAKSSAKTTANKAELPYCDSAMSEQALAEQERRIQARADALAAHKPLPEPAPTCRPWPKKLSPVPTPTPPIDSR